MKPRLVFRLALTLLLGLSSAARVHAHAGPQVRQVLYLGSDQNPLLLSNRGFIFGNSGPKNWSLMCNDALGINTAEIPTIANFADGRIMVGTSRGLQETTDSGCSWHGVDPYGTLSAPSLAQDLQDPQRLFLTTYGDGGQSGVSASHDGGKTWERIFSVDDKDFLSYLLIAPSQTDRLYVRSLSFGTGSMFHYEVLRSDNAGKDWSRADVAVLDSETDLLLLGVSPYDPDFVIAMAEAADPISNKERLLVSHDAGKTFVVAALIQTITQVTWSSDHKSIYVAADEGLFRSTDDAQSFARVGPAQLVSCVQEHDGVLLACGYYHGVSAGEPGVGMSSDGGETMNDWMKLSGVLMPLSCDPQAETSLTCAPLWVDWEREILGTVVGSAGAGVGGAGGAGQAGSAAAQSGGGAADQDAGPESDASTAAGSGGHPSAGSKSDAGVSPSKKLSTSSCGCRVVGTGSEPRRTTALWLIAAFWLVARRKRVAPRFAR